MLDLHRAVVQQVWTFFDISWHFRQADISINLLRNGKSVQLSWLALLYYRVKCNIIIVASVMRFKVITNWWRTDTSIRTFESVCFRLSAVLVNSNNQISIAPYIELQRRCIVPLINPWMVTLFLHPSLVTWGYFTPQLNYGCLRGRKSIFRPWPSFWPCRSFWHWPSCWPWPTFWPWPNPNSI